jgi:hypothetical protein
MKKINSLLTIFVAIAITILTSSTTANAAVAIENKTGVIEQVCAAVDEKQVFGYEEDEFDLNANSKFDLFDLIMLKQKALNSETGVTEATVIKLTRYLIGSDEQLGITILDPRTIDNPSDCSELGIQNLLSHDFSLISCKPYLLDGIKPSIKINFLGIDEYVIESIVINNIAPSITDLETIVATNTAFAIGITDDKYYLAPVYPSESVTEVVISDEQITEQVFNFCYPENTNIESLIGSLKQQLEEQEYEFTIATDDFYNALVTGKAENAPCIKIVANSIYPFEDKETIIKNDVFELFYYPELGYGITPSIEDEYEELSPAYAVFDLADYDIDSVNASILIDQLKDLNMENWEFEIDEDGKLITIVGSTENSVVEIWVQETMDCIEGQTVLENEKFEIIYDAFGFGCILK